MVVTLNYIFQTCKSKPWLLFVRAHFHTKNGANGGRVVKLLACGTRGLSVRFPASPLGISELLSLFSYGWKIAKSTLIKNNGHTKKQQTNKLLTNCLLTCYILEGHAANHWRSWMLIGRSSPVPLIAGYPILAVAVYWKVMLVVVYWIGRSRRLPFRIWPSQWPVTVDPYIQSRSVCTFFF